ncbi:MAG: PKD domain-containing protein, partial [Cyclobacteriaceae bacterium]
MNSDPYERMSAAPKDRLVLFIVGMVMMAGISWSQNITETQWYFGNSSQNLVFDLNGRDVAIQNNQATPFGQAGSSVIVDQFDGSVLFYSDGQQVYDGSQTLVSGALNGDATLNVPVATAPVSGNPGEYYLFTNSGTDIEVSIADANTNAITSLNQVVSSGLTNPAEGMLIVPAGDGVLFWLITQDVSTFDFQVTRIDGGGIGATIPYDFSPDGPTAEAAHFSFNQDSSWIAVAPKTANRNVKILDFDATTGVLSFERIIQNTGFDDGQGESVYDLEWSNDGSKLYISRYGSAATTGNIYQYDFADPAAIPTSILTAPLFRSYGLQTALDGRIYHLYQETGGAPYLLGRINESDSVAALVAYEPMVFTDDFQAQQFPNFTGGYFFTFNELNFTYLDSCLNDNTKYFPIVDPVPHQYFWGLGDGTQTNAVAPIHAYDASGSYNVTLTATINGISQSITQPVQISANTATVDLGNDTTICVNEILVLDAGPGGSSYVWSNGGFGRLTSIDTAGTYWVEKIGPEGCPAYDEIVVTEYGVNRTVNNQWYFGEMAGIDFTDGATPITDDNMMSSAEGCATMSDTNGDLLFYTNGSTVWNKDHQVMMNGTDIGGDETANQSAIIMPFADETTMFYIFTTEEVPGDGSYQAKVAIVDMKRDTARGQVLIKNIALNNSGTEKLSTTSVTGSGWLLTHESGSNMFRTNFVSGDGILANVYSPVGEVHDDTDPVQATGAIKFSIGAQFIAATLPRSTGSFVELFDFDQTTGAVTNPRLIDLQETDPVYGVEFSPDLSKLYLTTLSATDSKLIQLDLDSINAPTAVADIQGSKFDGYTTGANYGTLQTGPDGTMYMAIDGSNSLGTLTAPNVDDAGAGFNESGFDL